MARETGFQATMATLARTPNQSAAALLDHVLEGEVGETVPAIRANAIQAYAKRKDEVSQRRFLKQLKRFTPAEIANLSAPTQNFRGTLRNVLAGDDEALGRAACHMIIARRAFDEFPALVTAANSQKQNGITDAASTASLLLARALHDEIARYRHAPTGRDPSFARRWALTALSKSVEAYADHGRLELVEAFLLVAPPDNPTLLRILSNTSHPTHATLIESLRTSPSAGAIGVLARLFDDASTSLTFLNIAAKRTDSSFRAAFLDELGYPVSQRALENTRRVGRMVWLEKPTSEWFRLEPEQQAGALQLISAATLSRRTKVAIFNQFLEQGAPLARRTACEALACVSTTEAFDRLQALVADDDLEVAALAARALRKHGFADAAPKLASLLDNKADNVRNIAKQALGDYTFAKFVTEFDELSEDERKEWGKIVAHTDSTAVAQLTRELLAATLSRKLRGLQMTLALGAVEELEAELLNLIEHKDAAIRLEAVRTLAESPTKKAGAAVANAARDANGLVRGEADKAIAKREELQLPMEPRQ